MDTRTGSSAQRSLFFYPDQPSYNDLLEGVRQYAGWERASSPETADWCVLYRDATWVALPEDDPYAGVAPSWINGRCRDISKRTVQRVFADVFGYPLAIDPLTHQGLCVRKSNVNAVKGRKVLVAPIPEDEISDADVYERLVDGLVPGLGRIELSPIVVGGTVVSVLRSITTDGMRTGRPGKLLDVSVVIPTSDFSQQELEQIGEFCEAMGLDFGKLDIIRDRVDQRLYILDANKTPHYNPVWTGARRAFFLHTVEHVVQAFHERFPMRSAVPASDADLGA
jgi:hypothetical protein